MSYSRVGFKLLIRVFSMHVAGMTAQTPSQALLASVDHGTFRSPGEKGEKKQAFQLVQQTYRNHAVGKAE